MKTIIFCFSLFLLASPMTSQGQDDVQLPDKLATLQAGYEGAIARATIPITQSYIEDLGKLKTDLTRAGNLEDAQAADAILKQALSPSPEEPSLSLPDRVATLKARYEGMIARARIPITQTYIRALQKLKSDYTNSGNLEAALATDSLLKRALEESQVESRVEKPTKLSEMSIEDFKEWLLTVKIEEIDGENTTFQFDGTYMISIRPASPTPRTHNGTEVEVGVISVPFSTDLAVIRVSDNLRSATIRYDEEPQLEAKIKPIRK
jgi:hypothetical protein